MKRKINLDIPYFFGALICFAVAYGLLTGYIQHFVTFAGALNEMACCGVAATMGFILMVASVEIPNSNNSNNSEGNMKYKEYESNLSTNPVYTAIQEKIREMLYEDLGKSDIREKIKGAHPNFPEHLFEHCFAEAFCSL